MPPSIRVLTTLDACSPPLFFGVGINGLIGSKRLFQVIGHHSGSTICRLQQSPSAQCGLLAVHGGFWIAGHQFDPARRSDRAGWEGQGGAKQRLSKIPVSYAIFRLGHRRNVKQACQSGSEAYLLATVSFIRISRGHWRESDML